MRSLPCARLFWLTGTLLLLTSALLAQQQAPADYFRQTCATCHTIGGGRLTGPDLKDVTQRRDRAWLAQFLQNPKAVIDSGDPYAQRLLQDARGVLMPPPAGMDPARAQALLDLIEAESKLPRSRFAGMQVSDRPFTPQDVSMGRMLFLGTKPLASGGPPCISCHTVRGLAGLGGGRLGPELSLVYERLQGRKGLSAWLTAPPSPTMSPVLANRPLQPDEILAMTAFFEDAAKKGGQDDSAASLSFFLMGLAGMVVSLVSFDAIWKKRLRGVRRALLHKPDEED